MFAANCERAILARLRSMSAADFDALDTGHEGAGQRLYNASREAASLSAILDSAKTKRFAYTRLRRMVLWACLGLSPANLPAHIPYLRVLAANEVGRTLLGRMRKTAAVPALTKPAAVRHLGPEAQALFQMEARAADLYALAYPELGRLCGRCPLEADPHHALTCSPKGVPLYEKMSIPDPDPLPAGRPYRMRHHSAHARGAYASRRCGPGGNHL